MLATASLCGTLLKYSYNKIHLYSLDLIGFQTNIRMYEKKQLKLQL